MQHRNVLNLSLRRGACGRLTSGVDAGVVLSLVGVAGAKIVQDDVLMDVVMLCLDDLLGEFRDGKLNVFVHSARLRPMFVGTDEYETRGGRTCAGPSVEN